MTSRRVRTHTGRTKNRASSPQWHPPTPLHPLPFTNEQWIKSGGQTQMYVMHFLPDSVTAKCAGTSDGVWGHSIGVESAGGCRSFHLTNSRTAPNHAKWTCGEVTGTPALTSCIFTLRTQWNVTREPDARRLATCRQFVILNSWHGEIWQSIAGVTAQSGEGRRGLLINKVSACHPRCSWGGSDVTQCKWCGPAMMSQQPASLGEGIPSAPCNWDFSKTEAFQNKKQDTHTHIEDVLVTLFFVWYSNHIASVLWQFVELWHWKETASF